MNQSTIYKYPFQFLREFTLQMPKGAKILHVGMQHGEPCIWALVDDGAKLEPRNFAIRGTGHLCAGLRHEDHIATLPVDNGTLIWHLFEIT